MVERGSTGGDSFDSCKSAFLGSGTLRQSRRSPRWTTSGTGIGMETHERGIITHEERIIFSPSLTTKVQYIHDRHDDFDETNMDGVNAPTLFD